MSSEYASLLIDAPQCILYGIQIQMTLKKDLSMKAIFLSLMLMLPSLANANVLHIDDGSSICGDVSLPMSLKQGSDVPSREFGVTQTVARIEVPEGAEVFPVLSRFLNGVASDSIRQMESGAAVGNHLVGLVWGKRAIQQIEKTLGLTLEQIDDVRSIKIITLSIDNPAANGPFEISFYKLFSINAGHLLGTFDERGTRCRDLK